MQEARKRRSDLSDDALLEMVKTVHGLALQDLTPHSHSLIVSRGSQVTQADVRFET